MAAFVKEIFDRLLTFLSYNLVFGIFPSNVRGSLLYNFAQIFENTSFPIVNRKACKIYSKLCTYPSPHKIKPRLYFLGYRSS